MVRKLPGFMFGGIVATAIAGGALAAAAPKTHVMKVVLPDGGVANVEYVGDVAPKVTIMPDRFAAAPGSEAMRFPSFAGFERMMAQMQRQSDELMREAQRTSVRPVGSNSFSASYGNVPAGEVSTTVVSVSNNGVTCTRTTKVVSQGPGAAPKVSSSASGQCDGAASTPKGSTHPA